MRRTKIAPRLHSMFITGPKHALCLSPADIEAAARELRALLAVARAARTLSFYRGEYEGSAAMCVSGNTEQLTRALARLRSVSAGKRGSK